MVSTSTVSALRNHAVEFLLATRMSFVMKIVAQVRRRAAVGVIAVMSTASALPGLVAQAPGILPNTISTVAGGTPTPTTTTAACPTNPQFTATDAVGDGCPAQNAVFAGNERSLTVDPQGNLYVIADTSNPQDVRRIDARSGTISIFAGAGSGNSCTATSNVVINGIKYVAIDKVGDGCPVALSGGFNAGRGLGSDPYGNIIIPVVGDYAVHFVCTAVSPLCTASQANVNLMRSLAGCTTNVTGYGTQVAGSTVGSAGDGGPATQTTGTCTTGVNQPRQAVGDKWENIYFTDNANSRIRVILGVPSILVGGAAVPNPLYAVLAISTTAPLNYSTPVQGNIYPIAGGGVACATASNAGGDSCPFYNTLVASTTYVQGIAVDNDGDFIFADGRGRLRTIYEGGTAIKSALSANGVAAPKVGYSYALAGDGPTFLYYNSALSGTYLGSTISLQPNATQRLAVAPDGNIYIGDQAQILFYDITTGSIRRLGGGTLATSCNASPIGDGCPLSKSRFGAPNSVLSVSFDNLGNLYIQDLANKSIRKVSATLLPGAAVNSSIQSSVTVHASAAATGVTVSAAPNSEFTVGATTCDAPNLDTTVDCTAPVTFAPKQLGQRSDPLTITTKTASGTTRQNVHLAGTVSGSALIFDVSGTPTTLTLGTATTGNSSIMLDKAGNVYVSGTQGISKVSGSTVTTISATAAKYMAVDAQGNVYATSGGTATITKYLYTAATGAYTSTVLNIPLIPLNGTSTQGFSGPLVVDENGVVYIADLTNLQVIKFSQTSGAAQQLTQTALTAPSAISQDSYGNLLVVDKAAVLKVPASGLPFTTASPVTTPALTFSPVLTQPTSVSADQGENVYIADSGKVLVRTLSGAQYVIPGVSGTSVAVDGAGNLYVTAATRPGITEVLRGSETHDFGTDVSTPYAGVLLNAGASPATAFSQTDTGGNFSFLAPAAALATGAPTCNLTSTALAGGAGCNIAVRFAPTAAGNGVVQDVVTLLPAPNTIGALSVTGTKNGSIATTTTTVTGNTTGLVYSTGQETSLTVTVTQSTGTPTGSVSVSIDGGAPVNYALTAGTGASSTATVPILGLSAKTHTVSATYAGSPGIAGSTSPRLNFTIAQAGTTIAWTPTSTTQQFSAAIGSGVLNATAVSSTVAVPGVFVYSATKSGGSAVEIHSASYLSIGTYSLGVTFFPTDATDFKTSTASVSNYAVTKASTSAAVGASTSLVAADGSGNFTTVQAAINALPATGGSVYIKPGTYNGFVTVVTPNVALRGLGGDPTKVVLTHSAGAFSVNPGSVYNYTGEFTAANSNGAQNPTGSTVFQGDEGSATMVVARGTIGAVTNSTPNNFYGENFTLLNTYDSDTTTTTTTYVKNNVCTANAGPARTYNDLFNSGLQCASQALAIWITSDLAIMNNVYTTSLQDTIYAGSQGASGTTYIPARQYWFRGKVTGTVDYIFGDAAAVFDYSSIYSVPHGTGVAGTATIEAQNKAVKTSSNGDYLSGYIMNSNVFTTQATGMTGLYFGRPYGTYSTWVMLNSYVDQVNPQGYLEFSGLSNLPTSTYSEYKDIPYTDPATGAPDLNGVTYLGKGTNSGAGLAGPRETISQNPGTPQAANAINTSLTQPQAQQYYTNNFLGMSVPASFSTTTNWVPTSALAAAVNAFVPGGSAASIDKGASVAILMRPQTPGLGAITNGVYTVPTGTYTLLDGATVLATGSLDAGGEAYFTTNSLAFGTHKLTWTYSGDGNFSGSTTATPYIVTVKGLPTTTTLTPVTQTIVYGSPAALTATVATTGSTAIPTGTVTLTIDGSARLTQTLSATGVASFTAPGLSGGTHTFVATYNGDPKSSPSTSTASVSVIVTKAATTLALSANLTSLPVGTPITLTAQISSPVAGTPTGPVTFLNGTTVIGTATPNAAGLATLTLSTLPVGVLPITASYAGDGNYQASVSTAVSVTVGNPDFSITVAPSTQSFNAGQPVTFQVTTTPAFGFNQPISFSCSGLPANSTCTFAPSTVTPAGGPVSTTLTINTDVMSALLQYTEPIGRHGLPVAFATLLLIPLISFRLRRQLRRRALLVAVLTAAAMAGVVGCASGPQTPTGAATVTITATSGTITHTTTVGIVVR